MSWGIKQNPIDGNWLLMDGDEPLLNFYQNEALAESVLMVIRWAVKEAEDQKAAAEREAIRVDGLHRDSLIAHNEAHLKTIEEAMALKSRALAAEAALADSHKNAQDLHSDNCRLALELDSAKSALEQARESGAKCWLRISHDAPCPVLVAPAASAEPQPDPSLRLESASRRPGRPGPGSRHPSSCRWAATFGSEI